MVPDIDITVRSTFLHVVDHCDVRFKIEVDLINYFLSIKIKKEYLATYFKDLFIQVIGNKRRNYGRQTEFLTSQTERLKGS